MKTRTMNPVKLLSKRGKNKLDDSSLDEMSVTSSSSSISLKDGGSFRKSGKGSPKFSSPKNSLLDVLGAASPMKRSSKATVSVLPPAMDGQEAMSLNDLLDLAVGDEDDELLFSTTSPKKSVTINEDVNVTHECSHDMTLEEIASELWYSSEENEQLKEANNFSVKTMRRSASASSSAFLVSLDRLYEQCNSETPLSPHDTLIKNLAEQLSQQAARTGLEGKLCKQASKDKSPRRNQLLDLIYNFQPQNKEMSEQELILQLAAKCQQVSLPSRQFATYTAQAAAM